MFHCKIQNDHEAIAKEETAYRPIPDIAVVIQEDVLENYIRIKAEIDELIRSEMMLIEARKVLEDEPYAKTAGDGNATQTLSM